MTVQAPSIQQKFEIRSFSKGDIIAGMLAFLAMIGVAAGVGRLFVGMGASTALTDSYPWGIWIGFDFTLIALSGVGFTMAAVVTVPQLHQFQPVLRPAILAGLFGYVAVLMILLLGSLGWPRPLLQFPALLQHALTPLRDMLVCAALHHRTCDSSQPRCARLFALEVAAAPGLPADDTGNYHRHHPLLLHQSTLGTLYRICPTGRIPSGSTRRFCPCLLTHPRFWPG